jgi:hypothetical protein
VCPIGPIGPVIDKTGNKYSLLNFDGIFNLNVIYLKIENNIIIQKKNIKMDLSEDYKPILNSISEEKEVHYLYLDKLYIRKYKDNLRMYLENKYRCCRCGIRVDHDGKNFCDVLIIENPNNDVYAVLCYSCMFESSFNNIEFFATYLSFYNKYSRYLILSRDIKKLDKKYRFIDSIGIFYYNNSFENKFENPEYKMCTACGKKEIKMFKIHGKFSYYKNYQGFSLVTYICKLCILPILKKDNAI